jgi:bifunctional non-homologous end joining protein LigD
LGSLPDFLASWLRLSQVDTMSAAASEKQKVEIRRIGQALDSLLCAIDQHTSPYRSGRNDTWTKSTCRHRDTFVIAGLAHKGSKVRRHLSRPAQGPAVGLCRQGRERVQRGAGEKAQGARRTLEGQEEPIKAARDFPKAEWLKPKLLAEVEYRRRTSSGLLRHPSYKGMRSL